MREIYISSMAIDSGDYLLGFVATAGLLYYNSLFLGEFDVEFRLRALRLVGVC